MPYNFNLEKAIILERVEQLSLEIKRAVLISSYYAASTSYYNYLSEIVLSKGLKKFNSQEASEKVKESIINTISLIPLEIEDFYLNIYCAEINEKEIEALSEKILKTENSNCSFCKSLKDCKDFIDVEISSRKDNIKIRLGKSSLLSKPKLFLISIYSKKFKIAKVSYIPPNEEIQISFPNLEDGSYES